MTVPNPNLSSLFELEYPQSVGVYDTYAEAQRAVDFLSDNKFAVENLAIVGTELKSVERITGRKNWGTVLLSGMQSGISTGLMVALIMWFLQPAADALSLLPAALGIGIAIGVIFAAIGYAMSRGKRDFNSISQTVATKYEVLCQHRVAAQARELLRQVPGARAAQFDPRTAAQYPGQQYYGQQYPQGYYGQYPQVPPQYPYAPGQYPAQVPVPPAPASAPEATSAAPESTPAPQPKDDGDDSAS